MDVRFVTTVSLLSVNNIISMRSLSASLSVCCFWYHVRSTNQGIISQMHIDIHVYEYTYIYIYIYVLYIDMLEYMHMFLLMGVSLWKDLGV